VSVPVPKLRLTIFGHPVRHSISPAIHAAAFEALGLPHSYTAIDVPSESSLRRLLAEVRRGAIHGANVTVPFKRAVLDMVDVVAPSAAEVGAANVLARDASGRVVAHNTDADALVAELGEHAPPRGRAGAVIVGSGGAGLAALVACRRLGYRVIGMTSRSWSGSEALLASDAATAARALGALTSPWPADGGDAEARGKSSMVLRLQWRELAQGADVVIQATSAGMTGADDGDGVAAIVPWDLLSKTALAYDVVYVPRETPFLSRARAAGLFAKGGLGMLVRQAALSFRIWTGLAAPEDVMRRAAEIALEEASSRGG
jgi:shikimate dehydrogenase